MNNENKRIFINDLPETVTQDELENKFSQFGTVCSIQIKERKELGPHNKSLFFAYINLITDDKTLNECFKELSKTKWHGQHVQLQMARESFLERLKREREENLSNKQNAVIPDKTEVNLKLEKNSIISISKKSIPNSKTQETSQKLQNGIQENKILTSIESELSEDSSEPEDKSDNDIKIRNNVGKAAKILYTSGLKIPSVGKEPIIKITKMKNKVNDSEANLKRLQSLRDMKKNYAAKKSLIKNSLSYGANNKPNNKIIFDDNNDDTGAQSQNNGVQTNSLFNDKSDDESDFEVNFDLKEQFQGKSGQKLLELQSKYKNDKRFALDKRFIVDECNDDTEPMDLNETSEETLEEEKKAQLKILGDVLGRPIPIPSKDENKKDSAKKKSMLRFDPSQPDHKNLEVTATETDSRTKKKKKDQKEVPEISNPVPEVSKDVFYKVTSNLKFEEKQISLLSMFGNVEQDKDDIQEGTEKELKHQLVKGQNPFKYDSSDDENDIEDVPHKNQTENTVQNKPEQSTRATPSVFWTEPFFFKTDDFRLQEGLDFIEKIKTENKEFVKIRRDLKGIVKAKVRNNERKNKMFKKKLGGSKRRKHIRIKKALKR